MELAKTYLDTLKNPPAPVATLTWAEILAEEPFEGEHWEGIFTTSNNSQREEWDSSPSLSPLNSDDLALDEDDDELSDYERSSSPYCEPSSLPHPEKSAKIPPYTYEHRSQFEQLRSKQYWRNEWRIDGHDESGFSLGNPSTLGEKIQWDSSNLHC